MNIAIRVDASSLIGTGHFMRCLTLADALKQSGQQIRFISRELPGYLQEILVEKGHEFVPLATPSGEFVEDELVHAQWLGVSQEMDAEDTLKALSGQVWDWLIVDHYALDARWESELRQTAKHLFVIDDIANRIHDCDLLLDQNYENPERYRQKVNVNCLMLLGPHFALLKPEYAARRTSSSRGSVNRVLVFFGGSDPDDLTGMALEALSESKLSELHVDVVIGSSYSFRKKLERQAIHRGKTAIYGLQPHLADLMASADFAIGAGGATNWERMCLGLPSIVITLADNQVPVSEILHRKGALRLIGTSKEVTVKSIRDALIDEIFSHRYSDRVNLALAQCDGLGLNRVVQVIHDFRDSIKTAGDLINSN